MQNRSEEIEMSTSENQVGSAGAVSAIGGQKALSHGLAALAHPFACFSAFAAFSLSASSQLRKMERDFDVRCLEAFKKGLTASLP